MKKVTKAVKHGLGDIKMYAAIGNHDTYPQDIFKGHRARENGAVNEWSVDWDDFPFLASAKEKQTFYDYGFYSAPLTFANGT